MFFPVAPIRTRILPGHVSQLLSWKAPPVSMGGLGACGGMVHSGLCGLSWWGSSVGSASVGLCALPSPSLSPQCMNGDSKVRVPAMQPFRPWLCILPAALGPHASAPAALGGETAGSKRGGPRTLMRSVFTQAGPIKCLKRN